MLLFTRGTPVSLYRELTIDLNASMHYVITKFRCSQCTGCKSKHRNYLDLLGSVRNKCSLPWWTSR